MKARLASAACLLGLLAALLAGCGGASHSAATTTHRSGRPAARARQSPCPGLRRSLDNAALQRLALIYAGPSGQQLAAQALNALAAPAGARCGGKRFVPELVKASRALGSGHLEID